MLILEAKLLDLSLCFGAVLPLNFRTFVAANMDELAREERDDFGQDVLEEFDRAWLGVEYVLVDSPVGENFERLVAVSKFWVGGYRSLCMARHLDFGHDCDVSLLRVLDDFFDVFLRIEAAMRDAVKLEFLRITRMSTVHGFLSESANGGQFRISLDFDSPALIVGQVPMECVQLVNGHCVDELLHILFREKVSGRVEHRTTIGKTRMILNLDTRHFPFDGSLLGAINLGRKKLAKGLISIEQTCIGAARHQDAVFAHSELVAFRTEIFKLFVELDHDARLIGREGESRCGTE